ncbi:MAG: 16S rRNA (guanine(527)-N(7))-methyltransferase RsmG [Prevotella sp.]|jgi:16S rRNA methyltransferase gidB|uniref:16S rRNA (guanine(527)-N(7))-methyltransferase RsmG n=1 Tax=Hoylesella saccharolytica TaxID=633701 RepID=UPI000F1500DC|nr:16S rRNA (guanine(527)-N(7))-methyltransferase RsmG [Hoylesella saccharolytica]RKW57966.1 MAG: 16S rRNA (guanine(527)-N(7))-methyltransferase RsmG [Prevotella sp.]
MEEILKYFSNLSDEQQQQFAMLADLYKDWNQKINVVSRKDIDNIYLHHILHSLAIAQYIRFKDETHILDFGTGGGFPGIPLAIVFPKCRFKLIDRTAKKIKVTQEISRAIGLENVIAEQCAGEEEKGKYEFVVSRAVMPLGDLLKITRKNISKQQFNAIPNGLICLKGGDLSAEIRQFKKISDVTPITNWFKEAWFREKNVIYLPVN